MSTLGRKILHSTTAALLVLSAAICAAPQSRKTKPGQQATEPSSVTQPKPDTPDAKTKAPSKQNAREQKSEKASGEAPVVDANGVSYSYEFTQPKFYVSRIVIEHDAAGRGKISFQRLGSVEMIEEPFQLSASSLERIRTQWDALRFLDSETNYQAERQYPHLGTMRLHMKQGTRERTTEFNWTNDLNAKALADEYRRAADQAILVFDLSVSRENQPLASPKLLDQLDSMLKRGGLSDPKQLVALLRDINTDERLPLIARNHAERLLKKIEK
ncbi:MAG: hypothetical protein WBP93_07340 [Pyrinomonadaceae bacterium]